MIKRIKELSPDAEIASKEFRSFLEKFESEINRGISSLCILSIINQTNNQGIYGYKILKELQWRTNDMLVIEEGTLYPLLKKLEDNGFIKSKRQKVGGRLRKNYFMTDIGIKIYNHLSGYYTKMSEAISPLIDIRVELKKRYLYCPNCSNKIDLENTELKFCEICGLNIQELRERRLEE